MILSGRAVTVRRVTEQPVLDTPTEAAIRDELQQLVTADLLGPLGGPDEEFTTEENPIDRYPLGRLAPQGTVLVPETQDNLAAADGDEPEEAESEPSAPSVPSLNPSSMGFTAHVSGETTELTVTAEWGRYEQVRPSGEGHSTRQRVWRRVQMSDSITLPLVEGHIEPKAVHDDQPEIVVRGRIREHGDNWLVSLFVANTNIQVDRRRDPSSWIFQVGLTTTSPDGAAVFLPRPDQSAGGDADDRAERRRLAMAYRFHPEFAVGAGTAVHAATSAHDPMRAVQISTSCVPEYETPATDIPSVGADPELVELAELDLGMLALSGHAEQDATALVTALQPLVTGYRAWIERMRAAIGDPQRHLAEHAGTAEDNMRVADRAADRIEAGIELLGSDDIARRAFGFTNHAMHLQRVHTQVATARRDNPELDLAAEAVRAAEQDTPRWRPFQLAFILLNLPALTDPRHPERSVDHDRAIADLLWFPTGGGKTEAYLGLTGYLLALRRLQPPIGKHDATAGVAVLMRYTLRLLTIQQFERATTLICAAEVLRRGDRKTWGELPFRVGLWVGGRVTPNNTKQSEAGLKELRRPKGFFGRGQGSPHQLTSCPWCGSKIEPGRDLRVDPIYRRTLVLCPDVHCPFGELQSDDGLPDAPERLGLPVLVVDEEIYRHPPSLLIGTVDKFALLAWRGETAALFGIVSRRCQRHGYLTDDLVGKTCKADQHGAKGGAPKATTVGCAKLRPPDLIIQDELHLISGPLGSLVGLYESAVDRLASWDDPETKRRLRPKVVASTATVRRANRQIEFLFDRGTEVFPPAGLSIDDSFFARQRPVEDKPGRRYIGICAHGSRIRSTLIRVYVSVLGAAQKVHDKYGRNRITDPYMTLVGYFNSLRDLGGMRRLADDDVRTRLTMADRRGLAKRFDPRTRELTSRMSSDQIRPLLDQLGVSFPRDRKRAGAPPIDILLATSMIAVGVDVSRLGVMVVCNQPKSTAEYIQATSRVGRAAPGIVFTVYNWARPRDLSHYESFEHFHATAYQHVEPLSVTPFAERAVDRGLTGVLVSLVRELEPAYNGNLRAQDFDRDSQLADHILRYLKRRAGSAGQRVEEELEDRLNNWHRQRFVPGRRLAYSQPRKADDIAAFLHAPGEGRWWQTTCPTSLRDVEPAVSLLLQPTEDDDPPFRPPYATDTDADHD